MRRSGMGMMWMHGAWYLWALPLAAFFLARWWRTGFWLTACWAVGTFAGALLTGRPFTFLKQAIDIASVISHERACSSFCVGEFLPSYGEFATVGVSSTSCTRSGPRRCGLKPGPGPFSQPVFWLLVICWICGLKADRWWADLGRSLRCWCG